MTEIIADNVGVTYAGAAAEAISDVSLTVGPGDLIGIVGESGSGKSTFARTLVGLMPPTRGSVIVDGRPWRQVRRRDPARRAVQMIFQDPQAALTPWLTATQAVGEVIRQWTGMRRTEADTESRRLLQEVGIAGRAAERHPRELSGGQCQRVGIARALACQPDILVADEPTSSLDVSVQAQVLNLLAELREQRQLSIVLISHNLAVVRYLTDDTMVMRSGRVVEKGGTRALIERPQHAYTAELVAAAFKREVAPAEAPSSPQTERASE